jgi:hypothetical protein
VSGITRDLGTSSSTVRPFNERLGPFVAASERAGFSVTTIDRPRSQSQYLRVLGQYELAGHRSLMTTQGYMHLSPAAAESAIRLLDERQIVRSFGGIVETGRQEKAK